MAQEFMDCDQYSESKEFGTSKLQLMDLCDDIIEIILKNLDPKELANCADTNRRINKIAQPIYSRKYRNHLLWIKNTTDVYQHSFVPIKINVFDARRFKFIRNFGKFIRIIQLEGRNVAFQRNLFLDNKFIEYILEYCAASLEDITLVNCQFFKLNKSQKKLHTFAVHDHGRNKFGHDYSESIKWMTNLRCFKMIIYDCPNSFGVPKALEMCIPTLEEVQLEIKSRNDIKPFIEFLRMNPQVETLFLFLHNKTCNYNEIDDKVFLWIGQYSKIKQFNLIIMDDDYVIANLRFKTIEVLTLTTFNISVSNDLIFDELKELNLQCGNWRIREDFIEFISRQKKLKKICFHNFYSMNENDLYKLQNEMPELEEIVFNCAIACTSQPKSILKSNFSSNWIMTETLIERYIDCVVYGQMNGRIAVLKFQRIQQNV